MRIRSLSALGGLLGVTACRPATVQVVDGRAAVELSRPSPERGRVRRDELLATEAVTLRDALNRTRPDFLRPASRLVRDGEASTPLVYLDGVKLGAASVLQLIQVAEVADVQYLSSTVARNRYGSACDCASGVIAIARWRER